MLKLSHLILFLFILLVFFIAGCAGPVQIPDIGTCTIRDNCLADEKMMLGFYENLDSHVSSTLNSPKKVCCSGENIDNSCALTGKAVMLQLYQDEDSHVSGPDVINPNYNIELCFSTTDGIETDCRLEQGGCSEGYNCVVSLYQEEDSHISSCIDDSFPYKLCCRQFCPAEFQWDPVLEECIYQGERCGFNEATQQNLCGLAPYTNSPVCLQWGPDTTPLGAYDLPYEQACCFDINYDQQDYYEWGDVEVIYKEPAFVLE